MQQALLEVALSLSHTYTHTHAHTHTGDSLSAQYCLGPPVILHLLAVCFYKVDLIHLYRKPETPYTLETTQKHTRAYSRLNLSTHMKTENK